MYANPGKARTLFNEVLMQRKATKQSRNANGAESQYISWAKSQDCAYCGNPGPCRYDHCAGSSAKQKVDLVSVQIGHYFGLPECIACAAMTHKEKKTAFGPHHLIWEELTKDYPGIPDEVRRGIETYGKKHGR